VDEVRTTCTTLLEAEQRSAARRDWVDDLRQDLRYGMRALRRAPLFSLLAVLTLALGIGANSAVFGVVKSVLLDALPYANADRLVRLYGQYQTSGGDRGPLSVGAIRDVASAAVVRAPRRVRGMPARAVSRRRRAPRVVKVAWDRAASLPHARRGTARGRAAARRRLPAATPRSTC
jgi:hypothetical protein